jgi:hypothetical protein
MTKSEVMTENYIITLAPEKAAMPTASPPAGSYSGNQLVTLTSTTEGAVIYYTTNGSTPTTASSVYTSAIQINTDTTLMAIAVKDGMTNSDVRTAVYTITILEIPLTDVVWLQILQGIEADNAFNGTLDLSNYTRSSNATGGGLRSNGTFDPESNISIGKSKIVNLILPNTTTGITDGTVSAPTFRYFTNLQTFSGTLLSTLGDYAFAGCTSLTITTLPAYLTSIGTALSRAARVLPLSYYLKVFQSSVTTRLITVQILNRFHSPVQYHPHWVLVCLMALIQTYQ